MNDSSSKDDGKVPVLDEQQAKIAKAALESSVDSSDDSDSSKSGVESQDDGDESKSVDSKNHKSGQSDTSSKSGSGSSSSTSSSGSGSEDSAVSKKSSKSVKSVQSAKSVGSNESFKSMNVTASGLEVEFKDLPPTSSDAEGTIHQRLVASPVQQLNVNVTLPSSPIVQTPCKSLVLVSQSPHLASAVRETLALPPVVINDSEVSTVAVEVAKPHLVSAGFVTPKISGKVGTGRSTKALVASTSTAERQRTKSETNTDKLKKDKKRKKDKVKEMEKSVERLEAAIKKVEKEKSDKKARRLKAAEKKLKKGARSKSSKSQHEEADSSAESTGSPSPKEPTTSSKIARIPRGRRLQQIAMSRTKELGLIKDGEIHAIEITKALRIIDSVQFKILPTHAYRWFNRIPGSHLPHIQRHLQELLQRYGAFVKVVAKLFLSLAQSQNQAKVSAIGAGMESDYAALWQFENDLARATMNLAKPSVNVQVKESSVVEGPPEAKRAKIEKVDETEKSKVDGKAVKAVKAHKKSKSSHNDPHEAKPSSSTKSKKKHHKKESE